MRVYKTEGIVLKRKNIGEADRLLTIFTKDNGKITIKAAGVRKITSRRASHIEPLNKVVISLHKGKGTPVLTEATTLHNHEAIKSNLKKVGLAYHICEIVDGLCAEGAENNGVYQLLESILVDIEEGKNIVQRMYDFEMELLHLLGFYPKTQVAADFNPS
ncbi:MAG TPA: DNA repair protein RecO, partial [Legionellaceae bacterium]|nr:DNA repair protein RecO [Legionellaceae bacterium]